MGSIAGGVAIAACQPSASMASKAHRSQRPSSA